MNSNNTNGLQTQISFNHT